MRILIYSSVFYPSVGGMEKVAEVLANVFSYKGCEVNLVTETELPKNTNEKQWSFTLYRRPSTFTYWKLMRNADVILHNCISLKKIFPDFLYRGKVFVIHHTWYRHQNNGIKKIPAYLKEFISKFAHNIYISKAIERSLGIKGSIIHNPFDDQQFKLLTKIDRKYDLVYLGRLVSDKGVDILLKAIALLKEQNIIAKSTIIGDGPDFTYLSGLSQELQIVSQVHFVKKQSGEELVNLLNQHKIMVIPSLWEEPFGIVALEGMACGCVIIGSQSGGLPEAIGLGGVTFPKGDVVALSETIKKLLNDPDICTNIQTQARPHLSEHRQEKIGESYIQLFKTKIDGKKYGFKR